MPLGAIVDKFTKMKETKPFIDDLVRQYKLIAFGKDDYLSSAEEEELRQLNIALGLRDSDI